MAFRVRKPFGTFETGPRAQKKEPSGRPGQLNFVSMRVNFYSHLSNGQSPRHVIMTNSTPKASDFRPFRNLRFLDFTNPLFQSKPSVQYNNLLTLA